MFSEIGTIFRVTTWGESHGAGVGAVIDGCPAGVLLCADDFSFDMGRRRPGQGEFSTKRNERDVVEIMSGVFDGRTTGTSIALVIRNEDHKSRDYADIADVYRPGHADFCYDAKFGFRDYRGGGRSSGRETAARVAAGVIAKKVIGEIGVSVETAIVETGSAGENDSFGAIVECVIKNCPKGLGEPVFGKFDAALAQAFMSIGAVKGVEFGAGFKASKMTGGENNDAFFSENGRVFKRTNNAGGVLGGITDGSDIVVRLAVKPTPSIGKKQQTVNKRGENVEIEIKGRHDKCVAPRLAPVAEAMAAIVTLDFLLVNMTRKMENVRKLYLQEGK